MRVVDRFKAAEFFTKAPFNYKIQAEFEIPELCTKCLALTPPEKRGNEVFAENALKFTIPFLYMDCHPPLTNYHLAPEIFISSSDDPNSPVGEWVASRAGIGGLHHIAYNVDNVEEMMKKLKLEQGWEFTTDKPLVDDILVQCFTKPINSIGGITIELISRPSSRGFSTRNVRDLMTSTKGI